MFSLSWVSLPPPSPSHSSRLSQSPGFTLKKKKNPIYNPYPTRFIKTFLPLQTTLRRKSIDWHWSSRPECGYRARLRCCLEGLPALAWLAEWPISPTLSFPDHLSTAGESETLRMSHMYLYLAVILSCQPSVHPSDTVPRSMCSYFHLHFFCWHI